MTTYYLDGSAAGTGDGSTWANAFTSIDSFFLETLVDGDTLLISYLHNEVNPAKTWTWSGSAGGIFLVSADPADDSPRIGATFESTGGTSDWKMRVHGSFYGIEWICGDQFQSSSVSGDSQYFEDCTMSYGNGSSVEFLPGSGSDVSGFRTNRYYNCTIDGSGASSSLSINFSGGVNNIQLIGCEFLKPTSTGTINVNGSARSICDCIIDCCTIEKDEWQVDDADYYAQTLVRSEFESGFDASVTTESKYAHMIELTDCTDGTNDINESYRHGGKITQDTTIYASDGSVNDYDNNFCLKVETNAFASFQQPVRLPIIECWVDSGSQMIEIHFASDETLDNADIWFMVNSPNDHSVAGRCETVWTQATWTTEGVSHETSTATWTGLVTPTEQKLVATIHPFAAGLARVEVFIGKPSDTIYVDPKPRFVLNEPDHEWLSATAIGGTLTDTIGVFDMSLTGEAAALITDGLTFDVDTFCVSTSDEFEVTDVNRTFQGWVKFAGSFALAENIITGRAANGDRFVIQRSAENTVDMGISWTSPSSDKSGVRITSVTLNDSAWHLMTLVVHADRTVEAFLDNEADPAGSDLAISISNAVNGIAVGGRTTDGLGLLYGDAGPWRTWPRAMTYGEHLSIYNAGR